MIHPMQNALHNPRHGAQRLPIEKIRQWEQLGYGMFIHFGMSTFEGRDPTNNIIFEDTATAVLYQHGTSIGTSHI